MKHGTEERTCGAPTEREIAAAKLRMLTWLKISELAQLNRACAHAARLELERQYHRPPQPETMEGGQDDGEHQTPGQR